MKPMGVFLVDQFGDAVYTIGFTAASGEYGLVGVRNTQQIAARPQESLESLMHELGHDNAFLDFRTLPPVHWLRRPATMSIRGYMPEVMDDWTSVVDGVFFIDQMTPATPLTQ